ncbi:MerR family transcriptional regulator [Streptococcus penaeicida]|uniref:MerR family transcriptional regulator n=1 Tax=Streptococcus penaeicida TaxID=1765960 RepID=A0A2N8LBV2_9STRE|nr:MerR family transcriptional regulator [Streptococcus penaeicida]PND47622.1 MerR family transcriptional regulator [Streptococcus penaeicida]
MKFTIAQVSKALDIPTSTLRYYDKEGLLPSLERKASGYRLFSSQEIEMLGVIECLKATGMSIKDIKSYAKLTELGDQSLNDRYQMFLTQKALLEEEMQKLQSAMEMVNHKCWYYETAIEAGTEKIHFPIEMSLKNKERFEKLLSKKSS